jgi:hypothetical protein
LRSLCWLTSTAGCNRAQRAKEEHHP